MEMDMKEMMKRCLSLGFSLTVIVFSGIRGVKTHSPSVGRVPRAAEPLPMPASVPAPRALSRFSGTVIRDGSRFALCNHDGALYALDSTGRAWPFEGEYVEVMGYLDEASKLLHICAIEAVDDLRAEAV
jgi:hypothetical protein